MFDNLTIDQLFGFVFLFISISYFILICIMLKLKRFSTSGAWALDRFSKKKSIYIKQDEEPKLFIRTIYINILFASILTIISFLLILGIIET